ncbi:sensor histidine kinase [Inconstantimicrobium mannanitabidum]|uniref:Two-component sensor histidine kinase n=1 Tax=Inconstantimicrobium mannanitabidum TaxID=1604901 RepID=A0ACB5RHB4_9CLOT|nr:sensor histidine kinase [Clostridium sp. TW13]GKX68486.1 two-component sensor histidine kinase [Clostridium sp. TW13]
MNKEVVYNKYILILKYSYIGLFIACTIVYKVDIIALKFALLLLYIINNQIRYFKLEDRKIGRYVSIFIDMLLAFNLYRLIGNFGTILFLPTLVDIIYEFRNIYAIIYLIIIFVVVGYTNTVEQLIYLSAEAAPIIFLGMILREQNHKKLRAQELYDRIRENEEELKRLNCELESYANTIEEIAVLRERNRISREIHDNVGHALSTIIIQLGAIESISKDKCKPAADMSRNLADFAKKSMEDVRSAVRAMKPREFEEYEGIIIISEMIKNFKKLTDIDVQLRVSENMWKMNSDQSMAIYRIIQEFLSNSLKHGKATKVNIFMNFLEDSLRIHLKDNGVGCNEIKTGVGLKSMRERSAFYGGSMEYTTKEGQGFELTIVMNKAKLSIDGV